jgi:hypothetical protein
MIAYRFTNGRSKGRSEVEITGRSFPRLCLALLLSISFAHQGKAVGSRASFHSVKLEQ